jgi:hypothetical protein
LPPGYRRWALETAEGPEAAKRLEMGKALARVPEQHWLGELGEVRGLKLE